MRKIACLPDDDRRELFRNTADKMGLNDAIVEKELLQILIVSPLVTQLRMVTTTLTVIRTSGRLSVHSVT